MREIKKTLYNQIILISLNPKYGYYIFPVRAGRALKSFDRLRSYGVSDTGMADITSGGNYHFTSVAVPAGFQLSGVPDSTAVFTV